jgi:RNA polymerase sigma factor (sigma-70 family)
LLITIGKRRARDWWRDHQAERDELQRYCDAERDDEFARLPDKAEQLSLAIKRSEFVDEPISNAALNAAVRTLPIRQRLAVFLRYLAGLDAAETAEYMGISTRRVNQLLERACQELRSSPLAPGYDPEAAARRTEARS